MARNKHGHYHSDDGHIYNTIRIPPDAYEYEGPTLLQKCPICKMHSLGPSMIHDDDGLTCKVCHRQFIFKGEKI